MEKTQFSLKMLSLLVSLLAIMSCNNYKTVIAINLSTNSTWIVNDQGERVKLACTNWPAHMDVLVAEGLNKQPVDTISKKIVSMGFNCVRLTWSEYMISDSSKSSLTVRQSFQNVGLNNVTADIQKNNPSIIDLPIIKAFQAVVDSLGKNNLMVVVDNHVSKPQWCCSDNDGNGFFGDQEFNPDRWVESLSKMAKLIKGVPNVIAMSLRNELRGPKQDKTVWYRYMQKGAEAVHSANPDILVILSGLSYDTDLSFLKDQQVDISFKGKLVFEVHRYSWSGGDWDGKNPNEACGQFAKYFNSTAGFLLEQGFPLFVSEFGVNQEVKKAEDTMFLSCFLGIIAELDLDWAVWALEGSYYVREGKFDMEETFGLLTKDWKDIRNPSFIERLTTLRSPFKGASVSQNSSHQVIFHPSTGFCILSGHSKDDALKLGPCDESNAWNYNSEKTLSLMNTGFCLQANEIGKAVKLSQDCSNESSKWEAISDSKMHFSSANDSSNKCLDINDSNNIVTQDCKCLSGDNKCDPSSQWFKLVHTTRHFKNVAN